MTSNYTHRCDKLDIEATNNEVRSRKSQFDLASCSSPPPLLSERPSTQRKAHIYIHHVQLRDLVHPTEQRGIIYTVQANAVVRYDIRRHNQPPKTITRLDFDPTTIAYSASHHLLAIGGPKASLIILQLPPAGLSPELKDHTTPWRGIRQIPIPHPGSSIINSVSFAELPSSSHGTNETRLIVSSNEQTVRIYRISYGSERGEASISQGVGSGRSIRVLQEAVVQFKTCVNHASISPDGQTLLSVGDEPEAYIHSLSSLSSPTPLLTTGHSPLRSYASIAHGLIYSTSELGYSPSEIRFSMNTGRHTTMRAPKQIFTIPTGLESGNASGRSKRLVSSTPRSLHTQALFSTAWSSDGWKFAAGSQDGTVQVWDVRNLKESLQHFQTTPNSGSLRNGEVDSHQPCMGKTWGVRSLRFNSSRSSGGGELLVFSEHQSQLNVVDARTFDPDTRQVLHLPTILRQNPISQTSSKRRGLASVFRKTLAEDVREGKKRKRSDQDQTGTDPSLTRRFSERNRHDDNPPWQDTIPALRETLAQSFDRIAETTRSDNINRSLSELIVPAGHTQSDLRSSNRRRQQLNEDSAAALPTHEVSNATDTQLAIDANVEMETAAILETSGQLARRLRGVNSQLQQLASSIGSSGNSIQNPTALPSTSGPLSTISYQIGNPARTRTSEHDSPTLALANRRIDGTLLRASRRVEGILNRLQQRETSSPGISTSRTTGSSSSRTRERVDALRRTRDTLASLADQQALPGPEAAGGEGVNNGDTDISDDEEMMDPVLEPSFSRDLTRGIMRRWSRPTGNGPSNEQPTGSSGDRVNQIAGEPSNPVEQASPITEDTEEDNDAFWASIGMELDAQSATDLGFDEASSLDTVRALIDPTLAAATERSDSETEATDGHSTSNLQLNVGASIPSIFRREVTTNQSPIQRRLQARQLQALHTRMALQGSAEDVSLSAQPRPRTATPLRRTSFYRHSNESMDELQELSNHWESQGVPPGPRPLFTASPEPGSPPAERESHSFPTRSISSFLNEISARRTRFTAPASLPRPFSSRIFGNTSFYGVSFEDRHRDGEEDPIDGEDVVMEDEGAILDIAGFGFGLPGTDSEGYLYAGTVGKNGRGGRLIEFDLARSAPVERSAVEDEDEDEDEDDSETDDAGNGRRGNWIGRRYGQGSWV